MTSKPHIGPMLRLVLGIGRVLSPLGSPLLKRRLSKGKEDPARWREKLGDASLPRPDGPLVWLHGVGVGEVMALRGLIERMTANRPDLQVLVTSSARSSGEVFARNLPANTRHQYLPLDMPRPVAAFLDHWHPDLAVWTDQEVWPRLAVTCAQRGIPQAYVAARITENSARAKRRFGAAYGDLFGLLDLHHAQDDTTKAALLALMGGDRPVHVSGSLKAAADPLVDDRDLRAKLPPRDQVWLTASAHRADIDVALDAYGVSHMKYREDYLLIIAPRTLADAAYIAARCRTKGFKTCTRSAHEWPDAHTQVFIADSFGELGIWYRAAFAALIGGTFDGTQGHNPWEAVAVDCPVLHGPNVANFESDFARLHAADAARQVTTATQIADALRDPALAGLAERARVVRTGATRGLRQISDDLLALLDR